MSTSKGGEGGSGSGSSSGGGSGGGGGNSSTETRSQQTQPVTIAATPKKKSAHCWIEMDLQSTAQDGDSSENIDMRSTSGTSPTLTAGSELSTSSSSDSKKMAADEWRKEREARGFRSGW